MNGNVFNSILTGYSLAFQIALRYGNIAAPINHLHKITFREIAMGITCFHSVMTHALQKFAIYGNGSGILHTAGSSAPRNKVSGVIQRPAFRNISPYVLNNRMFRQQRLSGSHCPHGGYKLLMFRHQRLALCIIDSFHYLVIYGTVSVRYRQIKFMNISLFRFPNPVTQRISSLSI